MNKLMLFFVLFAMNAAGVSGWTQTTVYLFPGQGSDERLFEKIELDTHYKMVHVDYPPVRKDETMEGFAKRLLSQIDTTENFVLIGVSMGGMLCSELLQWVEPEQTILISSAETRLELPNRYRFQRSLPINKLIPKRMIKAGALLLQPIVEPDRKANKATFKAMLRDKSPVYYKRTVKMIVNWKRVETCGNIVQIHGTKDHTIPIRNVCAEYEVLEGSHMMTLTQGELINELLLLILKG